MVPSKNKRLFVTVFIVIFFVDITVATLDLSNVDWHNFQFFRYQKMLPYGELKNVPPPPPSITDHIQKASAVGTYVQRLLFGYSADDGKTISIPFPPTVDHLRERFQRKYGYRGQNLIEQLGNGYFRYSSGYVPCYSCKY